MKHKHKNSSRENDMRWILAFIDATVDLPRGATTISLEALTAAAGGSRKLNRARCELLNRIGFGTFDGATWHFDRSQWKDMPLTRVPEELARLKREARARERKTIVSGRTTK